MKIDIHLIIGLIIIILVISFATFFIVKLVMSVNERVDFCESYGGDMVGTYDNCIIKENGEYVKYEIKKYKGELILVK